MSTKDLVKQNADISCKTIPYLTHLNCISENTKVSYYGSKDYVNHLGCYSWVSLKKKPSFLSGATSIFTSLFLSNNRVSDNFAFYLKDKDEVIDEVSIYNDWMTVGYDFRKAHYQHFNNVKK